MRRKEERKRGRKKERKNWSLLLFDRHLKYTICTNALQSNHRNATTKKAGDFQGGLEASIADACDGGLSVLGAIDNTEIETTGYTAAALRICVYGFYVQFSDGVQPADRSVEQVGQVAVFLLRSTRANGRF